MTFCIDLFYFFEKEWFSKATKQVPHYEVFWREGRERWYSCANYWLTLEIKEYAGGSNNYKIFWKKLSVIQLFTLPLYSKLENLIIMNTPKKTMPPKSQFFKMVLEDKRLMSEYVKKHGSLNGYKSDHFEFAHPISL